MRRSLLAATALVLATTLTAAAGDDLYPCRIAQPGTQLGFNDNRDLGCMLAFLLRGSDGHVYALTEARCAGQPDIPPPSDPFGIQRPGARTYDRVWAYGQGRTVSSRPYFSWLGFVVHQHLNERATGYALVRIAKGTPFDGTACGLKGPTGIDTSTPTTPQHVWMPPPPTVAPYWSDDARTPVVPGVGDHVAPFGFPDADTVTTTINGNGFQIGLPVLSGDDQALGLWVYGGSAPDSGQVFRVSRAISASSAVLGIRFTLVRGGERGRAR